jgi:KaiC/GvpD/RAD55 family RecA-like ATPase
MRRKEINERSPIRLLEASIHGGLGRGNIGVVIARHGVGKTAFLVGVALDDLLRGQKVLHVSLEHTSEKVRAYYDEIFQDLAHERELENAWDVLLQVERNRRIHCYLGSTFSAQKLREGLRFKRAHGDFHPAAIMIDGYPFERATSDDLSDLRRIAQESTPSCGCPR